MNYLAGYGSSDEEETPKPQVTLKTQSNITLKQTNKPPPQYNLQDVPSKKNKIEIYKALGLKNQIDMSDSESEEEDLSNTLPETQEIEEKAKGDKLEFRPKKTVILEKPELVAENPSMKEGSDFLNKFNRIIKGDAPIIPTPSISTFEIPKVQNVDLERKETIQVTKDDLDDEFEAGEEEEEEVEEESEEVKQQILQVPDEIQREIKLKGIQIVDMAPQRSDWEINEQKRKELINRYKYQEPLPKEKMFTDLERSKSQLSYLAHSTLKNARERQDKDDEIMNTKKKTKRDMGW